MADMGCAACVRACLPCLQKQWTPLHKAAEICSEEVCQVLIENGADVNARDKVMRGRGTGACRFDWDSWRRGTVREEIGRSQSARA